MAEADGIAGLDTSVAHARVVYVDNDPIVLRHAQALLRGTPEGATAYLQALVQVHQWRPDPGDSAPEGTASAHGAVARKP